jgi:hypothetical protein
MTWLTLRLATGTTLARCIAACMLVACAHDEGRTRHPATEHPFQPGVNDAYLSGETVRFARLTDQQTGERLTMAIVGDRGFFSESWEPVADFPTQPSVYGGGLPDKNFGYLAAHLRGIAIRWDIVQYKAAYPEIPESFFESMLKRDPGTDDHSALVMIFRGDDANDVVSTFRTAEPEGLLGKLPLDKLHGRRITPGRLPVTEGDFTELDALSGQVRKVRATLGLRTEFKNLVKHPSLGPEIVPLMLFAAERFHLTYGQHYKTHLWDLMSIFDGYRVLPDEHWLICDARMLPYYQRLGFEIVEENIDGSGDYALKITREAFVKALSERFEVEGSRIIRGTGSRWQMDFGAYDDFYKTYSAGGRDSVDRLRALFEHFSVRMRPEDCGHLFKTMLSF